MAVSFSERDTMYADGVRADSVQHLAPYWDPRNHNDFVETLLGNTQMVWFAVLRPAIPAMASLYGPHFSVGTALGKLLTADRLLDSVNRISRFEPNRSWSDLPTEPPEDFHRVGSPEAQALAWEETKQRMIEGALTHRRFTVTQTGYLGLVPELTEVGDLICVLFGCDTPLVLRPVDDHYILVGECFVCGLMDGELIDLLVAGRAAKERFDIR